MKKYMLMLAVPALLASCGDKNLNDAYDASGEWDVIVTGVNSDGEKVTLDYTSMSGAPVDIMMTDKVTGDFRMSVDVDAELPADFEFGRGNTKRGEVRIYSGHNSEEAYYLDCDGDFNSKNNIYTGECVDTDAEGEVVPGTEDSDISIKMTRR